MRRYFFREFFYKNLNYKDSIPFEKFRERASDVLGMDFEDDRSVIATNRISIERPFRKSEGQSTFFQMCRSTLNLKPENDDLPAFASVRNDGTVLAVLQATGYEQIYEDAYEMLEEEKNNIDIICIPTSIDSHSDYSVAAMKLGYDVICEKPVTGTIEEALLMKKTADETGRKLCVGFQNLRQ